MLKYLAVGFLALTLVAGEAIADDSALVNDASNNRIDGLSVSQSEVLEILLFLGAEIGLILWLDHHGAHPASP